MNAINDSNSWSFAFYQSVENYILFNNESESRGRRKARGNPNEGVEMKLKMQEH